MTHYLQPLGDLLARLARASRARLVAPLGAGGVTLLVLGTLQRAAEGRPGVSPTSSWVAISVLALAAGVVGAAAGATWRRIWGEPGPDRWSQVVYGLGVRRFGLLLATVMPPLQAVPLAWWLGWDGAEPPSLTATLVRFGLDVALWWGILGPWAGFAWGTAMAGIADLKRPRAQSAWPSDVAPDA